MTFMASVGGLRADLRRSHSEGVQTGYSAAANTLARHCVDKSEDELFGDPIIEVEDLGQEVSLSVVDTEDAIHELHESL
jgi:hypothetical protein